MSTTTPTTTTPTGGLAERPARPRTDHADPGFGATLAGEWAKLRTGRGVRRNLLLGALLGIGFSALLAFASGATFDEWSAADQAAFHPIEYSLSGGLLTAIFFAAVGVNAVASEYSSGMIRLTLAVTPRRHRVIGAKAIVVGAVTLVAGVVSVLGMFAASQAIFGAYDLPTADWGDGDVWRTIGMVGAISPLFPVLAVFVTFLLRSTAASLSTVLAVIFVPSMLGGLLPRWWQENVLSLLPGPASDALALSHLTDSDMYLPVGLATVVVIAWVAVLYALARLVVNRRDA